ncbi:MAG: alpha/beta fold hydrolase [Sphingomicrobium sp.]
MTSVALAQGSIGYLDRGALTQGRLSLVFLHGVGSDKSVWNLQLDHFGNQRRTLAFDYPGYGESAPRAGCGRDGFAAAIIEAMDALGVARAHICGLSLGGVIALALNHRAPQRCASLILADSFARHPDGQAIYDRAVAASTAMTMRALAQARAPALLGAAATDALRAEVIETMGAIDSAAYRQGAEAVWLADQRDRAAAVTVPTLVLCGDEDQITPPALSEDLARIVPGAELAIIPGAGHLSNIEQADVFNSKVDEFLSIVEPNT